MQLHRLIAILVCCGLSVAATRPASTTTTRATTRATTRPAPIQIRIDATQGRLPISPYLFGKNNGVSELDPQFVRDVGLRITRDSGGNNISKYNWRNDLSSHPDWYNNVYKQHLHERAQKLATQYGDLQVLYGLQVLGWVAKTDQYNFKEPPTSRPAPLSNLCGGGDPNLYLQPSTPKDTVDLLDYWLTPPPAGLGLDPGHFRYWHLDNEPECWSHTHDDVCPAPMPPEQCIEKFVAVAKELKRRYPNARIMAPGFTSEWFWWNWQDNQFVDGMPWMQYFVKRMAEESQKAGVQLIDLVDFHTYVGADAPDLQLLQEHRIFYDPGYWFPRANACKRYPGGGWNEFQRVELVFGRMEQWLDEYFGKGHTIRIAVTESGLSGKHPPMVLALWYASMLGTFADHGIEIFTEWEWHECFWEVLHLFSRYGREIRVQTTSSNEQMVSAYASVAGNGEAMTVIFLNRAPGTTHTAAVTLTGFAPRPGPQAALTLSNLPPDEMRTFKSHENNALKKGIVTAQADGSFAVELPPYSIVAVLLDSRATTPLMP